jgi:hypothetical protein
MLNKNNFCLIVFFCLCIPVFPQELQIDPIEISNFIDQSSWYEKYLPLEDVSEYNLLREKFILLNENEIGDNYEASENIIDHLYELQNKLRVELEHELVQGRLKINILKNRYESNNEVQELYSKFLIFEAAIMEESYLSDDICFEEIEELYSRLITRLAYVGLGQGTSITNNTIEDTIKNTSGNTYIVEEGDYFRKIAAKPSIYNDERLWQLIYNANKNDKNLLPNPNNPDLIRPGIEIFIPLLLDR